MPDPFKKVRPNEDVTFSAQVWNAMLDAAKAEERRKLNAKFAASSAFAQGDIIKIKNETGRALKRYSVVALDRPIFLPIDNEHAFKREVIFRGMIPDSAHLGKFAILIEPADVGKFARGYVDGVRQVKVDVVEPSQTCCDITPSVTDYLVTMPCGGSAQILWYEGQEQGTTGIQWAIVRIGTNCRVCVKSSSSSSSSSTSHECPTHHCPHCPEPASCEVTIQIVSSLFGPSFDNPVCGGIIGQFVVTHLGGCTWTLVDPATGLTAMLFWDGTRWTVEVIITGDTGSGIAIYHADYDCKTPTTFNFDDANSSCHCGGGVGTCVATVTP